MGIWPVVYVRITDRSDAYNICAFCNSHQEEEKALTLHTYYVQDIVLGTFYE